MRGGEVLVFATMYVRVRSHCYGARIATYSIIRLHRGAQSQAQQINTAAALNRSDDQVYRVPRFNASNL